MLGKGKRNKDKMEINQNINNPSRLTHKTNQICATEGLSSPSQYHIL